MALEMGWQPNLLQRRKTSAPLGLRNLGNTCYLNSVLQCLTYTPPLANLCLRAHHSLLCEKLDEDRKRECPFCILEKRIARSLNLDAPHDAPSKIGSCLRLFADHFQWGRQEDAHEFLRYVIDACHNTCLKLLKASGTSNGSSAAEGSSSCRTVVKDIFGGSLLSQVKCLSCGCESRKTDEIMDISLDLFQSNSLKDALRRFFQPEVLDGVNKYSCGSCKKMSAARKQMFILRAPNVLVIQLKRFESIHGGKINRDIAFEEILPLSGFMSKASQDPHPEYSLFGSIVHSGQSPESGHYYAYIKDPTGRWYCCNDAYVSLSTSQKVLSEKVYILFYLRDNEKPKAAKTIFPNNGIKCPDSNGNHTSESQKSDIISKPPNTRSNGAVHSDRVTTTVLKTCKVPSSQQIKFGKLKNTEKKIVIPENGHSLIDNKPTVVENIKALSTTKFHEKDIRISCGKKSMVRGNTDVSPSSGYHSSDVNASTDMSEQHNEKKPLVNGNGHVYSGKIGSHENGSTQTELAVRSTFDCHITTHNAISKWESNASGRKRKLCDSENHERWLSHALEATSSQNQDTSCSRSDDQHSSGELENFKQMLVEEAFSHLRICGWVDEVHKFMHARKRLCVKAVEISSDQTELRKELISEAKKIFNSKVPEMLKGKLIGHLKAFSEGKHSLDA